MTKGTLIIAALAIAQLIGIYPLTILLCWPIFTLTGSFIVSSPPPLEARAFTEMAIATTVGAGLGILAGLVGPRMRMAAMLVFLPPLTLVASAIRRSVGVPYELVYFGQSNEGLAIILITLPGVATVGYSLGAALAPALRNRTGRAKILTSL